MRLRALFSALLIALSPAIATALEMSGISLHGFLDSRYGQRLQADPVQEDETLAELRLNLDLSHDGEQVSTQIKFDLYRDDVISQADQNLETGRGWLDLREANLLFSPHDLIDLKIGRQILTWGTGDLLFINDLFPKDWQSFFIGRDETYLKAPSDAVMVSLFPSWGNLDIVYTPRFDADRYLRGERISYWNPGLGRRAGENDPFRVARPNAWLDDDEWAVRLSRTVGSYELALYGYDGFWKSPAGFDPVALRATFPPLRVAGASLRGGVGPGVGQVELGYYDSRADRGGDDPNIPNSEWRLLLGYEQEIVRNLTLAVQYYLEQMQHHDRYLDSLPATDTARDRGRQVVTTRLTWQLMNQNLSLSLFNFYSPTDNDGYLRPSVQYKLTDAWRLLAGANLFWGRADHTFFGQFDNNSNVYAGARYSF